MLLLFCDTRMFCVSSKHTFANKTVSRRIISHQKILSVFFSILRTRWRCFLHGGEPKRNRNTDNCRAKIVVNPFVILLQTLPLSCPKSSHFCCYFFSVMKQSCMRRGNQRMLCVNAGKLYLQRFSPKVTQLADYILHWLPTCRSLTHPLISALSEKSRLPACQFFLSTAVNAEMIVGHFNSLKFQMNKYICHFVVVAFQCHSKRVIWMIPPGFARHNFNPVNRSGELFTASSFFFLKWWSQEENLLSCQTPSHCRVIVLITNPGSDSPCMSGSPWFPWRFRIQRFHDSCMMMHSLSTSDSGSSWFGVICGPNCQSAPRGNRP